MRREKSFAASLASDARWGAAHLSTFAQLALLVPGVSMVLIATALRAAPIALFGTGPGSIVPSEVLTRVGACLIILAAIAHLSRRITRLPHVFGAVAAYLLLTVRT